MAIFEWFSRMAWRKLCGRVFVEVKCEVFELRVWAGRLDPGRLLRPTCVIIGSQLQVGQYPTAQRGRGNSQLGKRRGLKGEGQDNA